LMVDNIALCIVQSQKLAVISSCFDLWIKTWVTVLCFRMLVVHIQMFGQILEMKGPAKVSYVVHTDTPHTCWAAYITQY
jgi:hypothetical protein